MKEFIRFFSEYKQIFSYKSKEMIQLPKHTIISDCSNEYQKEFSSRFTRHFAELNLPPCEESMVRSIFTELIRSTVNRTRTTVQFKATLDMELDRIVAFLYEYMKINNNYYTTAYL